MGGGGVGEVGEGGVKDGNGGSWRTGGWRAARVEGWCSRPNPHPNPWMRDGGVEGWVRAGLEG